MKMGEKKESVVYALYRGVVRTVFFHLLPFSALVQ